MNQELTNNELGAMGTKTTKSTRFPNQNENKSMFSSKFRS
jgi:hypothetical protein